MNVETKLFSYPKSSRTHYANCLWKVTLHEVILRDVTLHEMMSHQYDYSLLHICSFGFQWQMLVYLRREIDWLELISTQTNA